MDTSTPTGVEPRLRAPGTLLELLAEQARLAPHAPAILALAHSPLDYAGLFTQVLQVRRQLRAMGVRPQDRVALVLPNGAEMAVAFLGVAGNAACAPLNPHYTESEFDFFLDDLAPRILIVAAGQGSAARSAAERRGIRVIELLPLVDAPAGTFTFSSSNQTAADDFASPAPEDIALILHTSGTTARPKMVPLTQLNLCASAAHIVATLALTPADRCLNVMPLFHIHGLVGALLSSLRAGASVICTPGFQVHDFFAWLAEERPTWYTAVPSMHQAILARARATDAGVLARQHTLRLVRSSSASLPPQVMSELERVFRAPVIEAYGMTEASHQMASNPLPPRARKPGSVGLPAGPRVVVLSESGSEILPPGQVGELAIKGPNVTLGYVANQQANEKSFVDGWFRTGDQGYLDDDGYIFITGRLKELINRGGEKISPREVDEALLQHPAVAQAVTFAMPDEQLGEDVAAAVVLREPGATEYDLRRFAAGRLAYFKVPRRVLILDELPKGATGKLQRIGLAQRLGVVGDEGSAPSSQDTECAITETEHVLSNLWSELLHVSDPGVTQRFRELGGDSMTALLLVNRISAQFSLQVELLDLFDTPTIRAQAQLIDRLRTSAS